MATKPEDKEKLKPKRTSEARTAIRGLRLTPKEVEWIRALQQAFPEIATETDLAYQAWIRGMFLMTAEAQRPEVLETIGYTPEDLANNLRRRLLPVLDFLAEQNELPAIMTKMPDVVMARLSTLFHQLAPLIGTAAAHGNAGGTQLHEPAEASKEPPIDQSAADDLAELGTGLL